MATHARHGPLSRNGLTKRHRTGNVSMRMLARWSRRSLVLAVALATGLIGVFALPARGADWQSRPWDERAQLAQAMLVDEDFVSQLNFFQDLFVRSQTFRREAGLPHESMDMACGVCGVVLNELEGLLAENLTIDFIQGKLDADLCAHLSGPLAVACEALVAALPTISAQITDRWGVSVACIDLGFCTNAFPPRPLNVGLPRLVVDLDAAPGARWASVCANATFVALWAETVAYVTHATPDGGAKLEQFGQLVNSLIDEEYAQEIVGCAAALGQGYGLITIANLGYELSDACTSIVMQGSDGVIMHGRNLDFFLGGATSQVAKALAAIVEFQSGGETQYTTATMAGYVGALSIQAPAFSITINTKFYSNGIVGLLTEVLAAIRERNATLVSFLSRDAAAEAASYDEAVTMLSVAPLVADVYYTVAGVSAGQGAILSRLRESLQNVTTLNAESGKWFIAVTNYPWWEPQPVVDDRLVPAQDHMEHYGPSMSAADLFAVLSEKPTLNLETIYSFVTVNAERWLECVARNCPYPCTQ